MALQYNSGDLNTSSPDTLPVAYLSNYDLSNPMFFNSPDYMQLVFEETTDDNSSTIGYFNSNRSITTSSICAAYRVTQNVDGSSQTFEYLKDGVYQNMTYDSIGPNSTTYLTSPNIVNCGPRCAAVWAYENNGISAWCYECHVTVSNVSNATLPEQRVSGVNARMAAGAIALQGWQSTTDAHQYQRFPAETFYGTFQDGNSSEMARNLRQFAIGVFLQADQILGNIDPELLKVSGFVPTQGLSFGIDHPRGMWAILSSLAAVHLLLLVLQIWLASRIIVIEDSYLAIALLMRPFLGRYEEQGCLLDKEQREKQARGLEAVYGPRFTEKGASKYLEISELAFVEKDPKGWEGTYLS